MGGLMSGPMLLLGAAFMSFPILALGLSIALVAHAERT